MKLSDCLIGPLRDQDLDRCFESAFPELQFFKEQDLAELLQANPYQAIVLLEPLQRWIPEAVWQSDLPLIGIGSKPAVFWPELYQSVLAALDGFICLDGAIQQLLPPDLARANTLVLPFLIPDPELTQPPVPCLFEQVMVLDRPWSANLAPLAAAPFAFFIQTAKSRMDFYLERSGSVYLDPLYVDLLPFKAALAGAKVYLSRSLATDAPHLQSRFDADKWQAHLQAIETKSGPEPIDLHPSLSKWQFSQTLPRAFAELQQQVFVKPSVRSQMCQYRQALLADEPAALLYLQAEWQARRLDAYPEIVCAFLLRLMTHAQIQIDPQQLQIHIQYQLGTLTNPIKQAFALQIALWNQAWSQALELLLALQVTDLNRLVHKTVLPWIYDPVFVEIAAVYPLERVAAIWLDFQTAYCLVQVNKIAEAQTKLDNLIEQHYFPALSSLLLSLVPHYPPFQSQIESAFERDRLNMPLALQALRQRGQLAQTAAARQQVLAECRQYQLIVRNHMTQNMELEGFLALERELLSLAGEDLQSQQQLPAYLLWEGALRSYSSLAQINRQWCQHLSQAQFQLTHIPFHPPETVSDPLSESLEQIYLQKPELLISHRWPPRSSPPQTGKWAAIIPWEMGQIPIAWVEQINQQMDRVWVPSEFVARSFLQSGVNAAKVAVIPNGVDTQLFRPEGALYPLTSQKSFRFLFVGGLIYRKGVDLLIKAYRASFTAADDVVLVIKRFGSKSHYANQTDWDTQTRADDPEILIIDDDLSPEALASLYRSCDVYVHPYRGEGFGMPILEAMASGLAAIIPDAGPGPEFCPVACSWQIPSRVSFQGQTDLSELGDFKGQAFLYEVDQPALCQALQTAYSDHDLRHSKAKAALQLAQAYDWQALYPQLRLQIRQLLSYPLAFRQSPLTEQAQQDLSAAIERLGPDQTIPWLSWFRQTADLDAFYQLACHCQPDETRSLWRLAVVAGLSQALASQEYTRLFQAKLPLPLRLQWTLDPLLHSPLPESSPVFMRQDQAEFADLCVSSTPKPGGIYYLLHGSELSSDLPVYDPQSQDCPALIWVQSHQQEQALQALGWPQSALLHLPLGLKFAHFGPHVQPHFLPESLNRFGFLSLLDWSDTEAWQDLLLAYASAFEADQAVNLVLKIFGQSLEIVVPELMDWLQTQGLDPDHFPELTLLQEDLQADLLPGLFRGVQAYIDSSRRGEAHWTLMAQASEIPVVACGPLPHVQSPYARRYAPGDRDALIWLLQDLYKQSTQADLALIKNDLALTYDAAAWQARLTDTLLRSYYLLQTAAASPLKAKACQA